MKKAPFGYSYKEDLLVVNEDEQLIIAVIHRLKDAGLSLEDIGILLKKRGFFCSRRSSYEHLYFSSIAQLPGTSSRQHIHYD